MEDKKKQRKSTRNFNMEKHVERHFDIEKEAIPVDTSQKTSVEPPVDSETGRRNKNDKNKSLVIIIVIIALAILAFFIYKGCSSNNNEEEQVPNVVQNDSTSKEKSDSISEKGSSDKMSKNSVSNTNEQMDNSSEVPNGNDNTSASSDSSVPKEKTIDDRVAEVWDGVYGNGVERKNKLGADYKAVQKRVNEMYRNGYRHQ